MAIPLSAEVALAVARLVPADLPALRRVDPSLLHFTLAFLGAVPESRVAEVAEAARAAARGQQAFEIRIDEAGHFPPSGAVRVVWAGSKGAVATLARLGARVRAELASRSLPFDDRELRPHVTLARVRDSVTATERRAIAAAMAGSHPPAGLAFDARTIHVMESVLGSKGPRYLSREEIALTQSSGPAQAL